MIPDNKKHVDFLNIVYLDFIYVGEKISVQIAEHILCFILALLCDIAVKEKKLLRENKLRKRC